MINHCCKSLLWYSTYLTNVCTYLCPRIIEFRQPSRIWFDRDCRYRVFKFSFLTAQLPYTRTRTRIYLATFGFAFLVTRLFWFLQLLIRISTLSTSPSSELLIRANILNDTNPIKCNGEIDNWYLLHDEFQFVVNTSKPTRVYVFRKVYGSTVEYTA